MSEEITSKPGRQIISYPDGKTTNGPKRFQVSPKWPVVVAAITTAIVAGGGLLAFVGLTSMSTSGATRSAKLRWEQIGSAIEQDGATEVAAQAEKPL